MVYAARNEVVQDDIQAQARRNAVGRGISHEGRAKIVVCQPRHVAFDPNLGFPVSGYRI